MLNDIYKYGSPYQIAAMANAQCRTADLQGLQYCDVFYGDGVGEEHSSFRNLPEAYETYFGYYDPNKPSRYRLFSDTACATCGNRLYCTGRAFFHHKSSHWDYTSYDNISHCQTEHCQAIQETFYGFTKDNSYKVTKFSDEVKKNRAKLPKLTGISILRLERLPRDERFALLLIALHKLQGV